MAITFRKKNAINRGTKSSLPASSPLYSLGEHPEEGGHRPIDFGEELAGHPYCLAEVWSEKMGLNVWWCQRSTLVEDKPGSSGQPMILFPCIPCLKGNCFEARVLLIRAQIAPCRSW